MYIKNVSIALLDQAAAIAQVVVTDAEPTNKNGTRFRVRLGLLPSRGMTKKWQAHSASYNFGKPPRKTHGVCFHGFLAFFVALAKVAPNFEARVNPTWNRGKPFIYTKDTTMAEYGRVGAINIGPPVRPIRVDECCACDE